MIRLSKHYSQAEVLPEKSSTRSPKPSTTWPRRLKRSKRINRKVDQRTLKKIKHRLEHISDTLDDVEDDLKDRGGQKRNYYGNPDLRGPPVTARDWKPPPKRLQVILRLSRWASALTVSPETSFKIQNSQQSSNETSAKDSTETPRDGSTISLRRIFTGLKTSR